MWGVGVFRMLMQIYRKELQDPKSAAPKISFISCKIWKSRGRGGAASGKRSDAAGKRGSKGDIGLKVLAVGGLVHEGPKGIPINKGAKTALIWLKVGRLQACGKGRSEKVGTEERDI